ncbi:MAG: efflux RND transporter permease subunit [Geminicoccaceae bacterium]
MLSIERSSEAGRAQRDLAQSNAERAKELRRGNRSARSARSTGWIRPCAPRAQVELTQAQLDKRILVAPFTGTAGLRRSAPASSSERRHGDRQSRAARPGEVDFMNAEIFLPAVAHGQRIAPHHRPPFPERSFTGVVKAIDPLIDKGGRSIVVQAEIGNGDGALRPGLFDACASAGRARECPVRARADDPAAGRPGVRLQGGGRRGRQAHSARLTQVELGARRRGEVEVRKGLAPGDSVITAGLLKIRDGVPIKPEAPPAPLSPRTARARRRRRPGMSLSELTASAGRVFASVLSLALLLIGLMAFSRLSVREYPNIDEPVVSVTTDYTGASPEIIESQVTQPLEEVLSGIEGVDVITSQSREGRSRIGINCITTTGTPAASDVRDRVSRARARSCPTMSTAGDRQGRGRRAAGDLPRSVLDPADAASRSRGYADRFVETGCRTCRAWRRSASERAPPRCASGSTGCASRRLLTPQDVEEALRRPEHERRRAASRASSASSPCWPRPTCARSSSSTT